MCVPQCLNVVNSLFQMGDSVCHTEVISILGIDKYGLITPDLIHQIRQSQPTEKNEDPPPPHWDTPIFSAGLTDLPPMGGR